MPAAITTGCVIAGGGPAGMMAGLLLARSGVDVVVLEKHEDFLRDFRGDTIHPSTMQVLYELGLLEKFLRRPHQEIAQIRGEFGDEMVTLGDMSHLPTAAKFVALMPQWDFLDFLADEAKSSPHFRLMMKSEAVSLLEENGRVRGVGVQTPEGLVEIRAELVIGADGRHSRLRAASGLKVQSLGVPIDVLWMKIARRADEGNTVFGKFAAGVLFVMLYRGDYWQCAFVIRKGGYEAVRAQGLEAFRARVAALARHENVDEIKSWDDVKLLTVTVDRLRRWWKPGLLFIGDAAHAMSPVGGIGINLAIQDAVAAANLLAGPLYKGQVNDADLARVQKRRFFPTWATQALQVVMQNTIITAILSAERPPSVPWIIRLAQRWTFLQRIPARIIGMGFRPEHIGKGIGEMGILR